MIENRLEDYLEHMLQAASDACDFIEGLEKEEFLADKRTQQAVIMSLIILGEASTKVMDNYSGFSDSNSQIPWRNMRGMRNRIAHGYFDINLEIVWETIRAALPELINNLSEVIVEAKECSK
ncbi:MAG: DUF86 domain-containing protein [Gammaproteobacteria bacterium]|nr:MAG: DUF86 domain-containing protein [Gammaproteobacteria bacterium]